MLAEPGLNMGAAFHGDRMAVVLSKDGNPDIYVISASTGAILKRLTQDRAIDSGAALVCSASSTGSRIGTVASRLEYLGALTVRRADLDLLFLPTRRRAPALLRPGDSLLLDRRATHANTRENRQAHDEEQDQGNDRHAEAVRNLERGAEKRLVLHAKSDQPQVEPRDVVGAQIGQHFEDLVVAI